MPRSVAEPAAARRSRCRGRDVALREVARVGAQHAVVLEREHSAVHVVDVVERILVEETIGHPASVELRILGTPVEARVDRRGQAIQVIGRAQVAVDDAFVDRLLERRVLPDEEHRLLTVEELLEKVASRRVVARVRAE
jgi:hypothetical protein